MCRLKEWTQTLTDVVAMTKKEYILTIASSLLGGIVIAIHLWKPRAFIVNLYHAQPAVGRAAWPSIYGSQGLS